MGQPVVHFEILGKDGAALQRYYGELFGWKLSPVDLEGTDYATVDRKDNPAPDGMTISGGIGSAPESDGHVTFYVAVDDIGAALEEAERLGGARVMGPMTVMEGLEIGLFSDPEGHVVGLVNSSM